MRVIITVPTQIIQLVHTADTVSSKGGRILLDLRLEGKLPIYEQLFNGISLLITSGQMKPDEKLPAVREVAKQFGINPNTVQKAYSQLEQSGFIYSMPAKGSYVSGERTAADALRVEALRRAEQELRAARRAGVTLEEIRTAADKIWNDGNEVRKGGEI